MTNQKFNPLDFLRTAEFLAERDPSEAGLRTAVSRTYYGVMLAAADSLGVAAGQHMHTRVIGALFRHDARAGRQLRQLMRLRVLADYDLDVQNPLRTDWRRNYQMARAFAAFVLGRIA